MKFYLFHINCKQKKQKNSLLNHFKQGFLKTFSLQYLLMKVVKWHLLYSRKVQQTGATTFFKVKK
jgi:hypothetical protein